MSISGQRPESLAFADCFQNGWEDLLRFKPGLIGPCQIIFRNEADAFPGDVAPDLFYRAVLFPLKASIDLEYFNNRTLPRDFIIMLRGRPGGGRLRSATACRPDRNQAGAAGSGRERGRQPGLRLTRRARAMTYDGVNVLVTGADGVHRLASDRGPCKSRSQSHRADPVQLLRQQRLARRGAERCEGSPGSRARRRSGCGLRRADHAGPRHRLPSRGADRHLRHSYAAAQTYVETNVLGTLNVLEAARRLGTERIVHTSTSEVYGTALRMPISEDHLLQGQSPYSDSKIGADMMAEAFARSFGLPVVTLRPF